MKWFGLELTEICFFYSYQKWHSKKCLNDALCHNCNIFTCTQSISMKLILLESYEADLSNSGYNIQFGEELTEIQTNLYSVCKHSDTFLAHCNTLISLMTKSLDKKWGGHYPAHYHMYRVALVNIHHWQVSFPQYLYFTIIQETIIDIGCIFTI